MIYHTYMIEIPNEIIPYALILILTIFCLALKKSNKTQFKDNELETILDLKEDDKRKLLEKAESRLYALKDLYKQELIDDKIYLKKTEMIASNLSNEIGKDIMELPDLHQKIIFNDLKTEIKKKVEYDKNKNVKTDIDNLISAVDKKIKHGILNEEK